MIKVVVFDMAGTTIDEDNVVYKTLQSAINQAGYNFDLNTILREGAGKEKFQAIKDILTQAGHQDAEAAALPIFEVFKKQLEQAYLNLEVKEQPGAAGLFAALQSKGIKVVLNTGYDRTTATHLIQKIGWEEAKDFDLLITASEVSASRPAPDMIELAIQKLNIASAANVLKIGDSIVDIEEGKNANCGVTLGITTGAQTRVQLEQAAPDQVIDHLQEVLNFID